MIWRHRIEENSEVLLLLAGLFSNVVSFLYPSD